MKYAIIAMIVFVIVFGSTGICSDINKPWGNNEENIAAAELISKIKGIQSLAVLSHDDTVLVGICTGEGADGDEVRRETTEIIRRVFVRHKKCLLGIDSVWANAVIEIPLYIDGGMDRNVVEKRFRYLASREAD